MAIMLMLRLDGVRGDSKVDGHVDWIPLLSLSYGSGGGRFHSGNERSVGDKTHRSILCTAYTGSHSGAVMKACLSGRMFNGRYENFNEERKVFLSFSFQGAFVTSFSSSAAGNERGVDAFELDVVPFMAQTE